MAEKLVRCDSQGIAPMILTIRGERVVLDTELARIYGVTTEAFNQAVKRNRRKFPPDFMFRLTGEEYANLRSQLATSNRSQIVTGSQRHRDPRSVPYAFTEHGAVMAATILHSDRAIEMSVFVVRTFIRTRQMLMGERDLARKLADLEKELMGRLDVHETAITEVFRQIMRFLGSPSDPDPEPEPPDRQIGFLVEELYLPYESSKGVKRGKRR